MTNRLSRSVRFLTLLLAAMQVSLPAVVSVADGAGAFRGRESVTHIEAPGRNQCQPPHSADCAVCRFLSATHGVMTAAAPALVGTRIVSIPTAVPARSTSADLFGFNSRAPPTLRT